MSLLTLPRWPSEWTRKPFPLKVLGDATLQEIPLYVDACIGGQPAQLSWDGSIQVVVANVYNFDLAQ